MTNSGKTPRTHIHYYKKMTSQARLHFRSGVSIHSHTHFSKENLGFIPHYATRIPWVAGRVRRVREGYSSRTGTDLDFSRAFWTPPFSPEQVLSSEIEQIKDALGLPALVSITDHDNIDAPTSMRGRLPASLEWTIPYGDVFFHLGIHNIETGQQVAIVDELQRYTVGHSQYSASELLSNLHRWPNTLVVMNHPLWDAERAGRVKHRMAMQAFLCEYREFIHAIEINGFRPWEENLEVLQLGESLAMPVVAGGDRHGTVPNTVLNLSQAATLEEFVVEIRDDQISNVVLMPKYSDPMFMKQLQTTGDAVRVYPSHPAHKQQWTDRVMFESEDGQVRRLSQYMPNGTPAWLKFVVRVLQGLGEPFPSSGRQGCVALREACIASARAAKSIFLCVA